MKKTISLHEFRQAFIDYGRENQFSYEGLEALFDFLEEVERSSENEMELDTIALCCEFTEYSNIDEFQIDYGKEYLTINDIQENTIVIPVNDHSFIIQDF